MAPRLPRLTSTHWAYNCGDCLWIRSLQIFYSSNTDIRAMAVPRLSEPPTDGSSYVIPQLEGELISIPGSKSVFRILASAIQTKGALSVFSSGSVLADAPGFHHHNEAHDVFLVTKGFLKLWNGDKCKILGPGDFASVPPVSRLGYNILILGCCTNLRARVLSTTHTGLARIPRRTDSLVLASGLTFFATSVSPITVSCCLSLTTETF